MTRIVSIVQAWTPFSILTRIDAPVTTLISTSPVWLLVSFSILTRIDAPVTLCVEAWRGPERDFQYPHTDRCPCNSHHPAHRARARRESFQYPHTDRCPCHALKVVEYVARHTCFQYPQTDRCPCN